MLLITKYFGKFSILGWEDMVPAVTDKSTS
jgi:hypothetical protein